ncbi:TNF receptor-associated factor 6 isoform X3 [Hippopotamus amphibius kiboko]|uniref:TNF receptor-associated factor 6 isoform X3 n=1 Tax=Hippopotamus amphibius kiboko TaxID=575201 RepID=UPI002591C325|nr:TNF receptor-associated factor 6 isoform X3 [Hippopotamus amphibius kiboko]
MVLRIFLRRTKRAVDHHITMSLLHCENSCGSSQSESHCCAAMAASSCGAAAKDDSVSGTASTVNLSSSFMEEIQGYDVEFDPPLESKYECPICLMALREAVQTPCGHRFCKACIIKSIRDAGHKCPVDNEILLENQLFPDNFAKREILSLMVKCPNEGCLHKMELRHLEIHDQNCPLANVICEYCNTMLIREQMPNHYDLDCPTAPVPCTFSAFGCHEKMQRNHLARHLQENTQSHMRMMAQAVQTLSLAVAPAPQHDKFQYDSTSPSRVPSGRHSEVQNFQETIQQLEGRLVRQDHQIRELTAKMETQSTYVSELKRTIRTLEDKVAEIEAQQCNGIYIWKIGNFGMHLKSQEEEKPVVIHSPGFYTGRPGYKLCMRLHLQLPSAQRCANYISLFVHTMQGEYDSHLPWPFQGTIRLTILDQSEAPVRQNHEEIMDAKPELLAFQRPTIPRNPKGFGYVTFMHLEALRQRTFIKDDTLLVRCEVSTRFDMGSLRREGFQPRSTDSGV